MSTNKSPKSRYAHAAVLLIDDHKAARILLRAYLTRLGIGRIEEATDSLEAIRMLMQTPPNQCPFGAVFVSRSMREMSGFHFTRAVRQMSGWADFPIVLVSEDLDPALVLDAFAAGATEYLVRPYDEDSLDATLAKALKL